MPIDPTAQAASLVAVPEISPAEQQNRYGMKRQYIPDLTPGKFLTLLAVQTQVALTPMQYADVEKKLKAFFGVEAMQTAFEAEIPNFGPNYRNDLHLQAHLRAENRFDEIIPPASIESAVSESVPGVIAVATPQANGDEAAVPKVEIPGEIEVATRGGDIFTVMTAPAAGDPTPSIDLV